MKFVKVELDSEGRTKVEFEGVWTRRDIERALAAALRDLPHHIALNKSKEA
jgi:hypothetical protein